jgi:hypothetical protein
MEDVHAQRLFIQINRLFWLIWVLLPFCLYKAIPWLEGSPDQLFLAHQEPCAGNAVKTLSETGQYFAWLYFGINTGIYLVLFGLMHRLVHGFAAGKVFLKQTLVMMSYIAGLVICWPLVNVVSFNLVGWQLANMGDLQVFQPDFRMDVMTLGSGFFLLVIRVILSHALALHEESRFTI